MSASSSALSSPPSSPDPEDATVVNTQTFEALLESKIVTKTGKRKRATTVTTTASTSTTTITKKPRKKKSIAPEPPMAVRTTACHILLGAHVSMAGGVENAIPNTLKIGGNAFALFLKSQRKWTSAPLAPENAALFKNACKEHSYDSRRVVVPHGSYLVNLAQPDPEKRKQALDCFIDDLQRCDELGIGLYNFHPGSTLKFAREDAIGRIADALNVAHAATTTVKTLLENMAGAGNVIGSSFEDLRDVIALVKDQKRVGVCLDTCHMFAAGYDIRTQAAYDKTMAEFDDVVGRDYLSAWHVNDSKAPLGSKRDLHYNIGRGFIGLAGFRALVNDRRNEGLPMVLETPIEGNDTSSWADEIKLLEGLIGKSEGEVAGAAQKLQIEGKDERTRVQDQVDRKKVKDEKRTTKGKKRSKKKMETESESESGCESC